MKVAKAVPRVMRSLVRLSTAVAAALTLSMFAMAQNRISVGVVTIAVSPAGDDHAAGTIGHPFRTLERAQAQVRLVNREHDVIVQIGDGTYRLAHPLRFRTDDGGRNGHRVEWVAAYGAHPVFSGGIPVTGWKLFDVKRGIYVAPTPVGLDSRQLWVNNKLMSVGMIEIPRSDVEFTRRGVVLHGPSYDSLNKLPAQNRMELRAIGYFTERIAPVASISGRALTMKEPAWDNNLWGYDTIEKPYHPELAHLYLANSLSFLTQPGQWYIDPSRGKLYLIPPPRADIQHMDVELPHLAVLMTIGGSLAAPVENLTFRGLRFSHTTWLGPSSDEGYASQQSGSFLVGKALEYPSDPLKMCSAGCPAFESVRNEWSQMPASIQVDAAERITFDGDVFAYLGQYALGIGNDADATLMGVGLGTGDITVWKCVFTDIGGGAILAGGVRRDAHHPRNPRETNRQLIVWDNRIRSVSQDYLDNSAILSTYDDGAVILHNDISDVPYDAIDIGYGWGIQDPGGNPNYRFRMNGYKWPQNPIYDNPTTHRDVVVANNRIHDAKKLFHDGGAIYNLSASPGTLITENYIFDNHERIALYLDEGSRYITVRRNVVDDPDGEWLNVNTVHSAYPMRISPDNTAVSNWHNSSHTGGMWTNYQNNLIVDDHLVTGQIWPADALEIMKSAGIEPRVGPVAYGDAQRDVKQ
ncbi:MAG TPA: right-handed parallel beta-helix repeat-containing protein [Acidobacteriaceae bacterium]|jgi:hypothetical protein|nr:right-handed parallel beta-helix repeat-containing protein [Acidobacteriaceae bacterium]